MRLMRRLERIGNRYGGVLLLAGMAIAVADKCLEASQESGDFSRLVKYADRDGNGLQKSEIVEVYRRVGSEVPGKENVLSLSHDEVMRALRSYSDSNVTNQQATEQRVAMKSGLFF